MNINVVATFTTDPFVKPLYRYTQLALQVLQVGNDNDTLLQFAGYNQVMQTVLNESSIFYSKSSNKNDVNVIFLQPSKSECEEFVKALHQYSNNNATPLVIVICPSKDHDGDAAWLKKFMTSYPKSGLICTLNAADLIPNLSHIIHDDVANEVGSIPYNQVTYEAISVVAARGISFLKRQPFKAAVIDCDNTLWKGVVGEDGPAGVKANIVLMNVLKQAKENGILLCLASKNVESDVQAAFEKNPEWPLKYTDFAGVKVNWEKKSDNIKALLKELTLSKMSDLIFIDDNDVEVAEVNSSCPGITSLNIPLENAEIYAKYCFPFDIFQSTKEDKLRHSTVVAERQRRKEQSTAISFGDYIKSLNIKVDISECNGQDEKDRVVQLSNRTNQFNFTTERLQNFAAVADKKVIVVRVADKHGEYGIVGVIICSIDSGSASTLEIENFMMSCRVLGRGVEQKMMSHIGEMAAKSSLNTVTVNFVETEKNVPAKKFLLQNNLLPLQGGTECRTKSFPVELVTKVSFDLKTAETSRKEYEAARVKKVSTQYVSTAVSTSAQSYHEIALHLSDVHLRSDKIIASIKENAENVGALPVEKVLLQSINEVLGVSETKESLSKAGSLMQLGLDSLNIVRIMSKVSQANNGKLPDLADFLRSPFFDSWVELARSCNDDDAVTAGKVLPPCIYHTIKGKNPKLNPLVLIHPWSGLTGAYNKLNKKLGNERDVYCVEHPYFSDMCELYVSLGEVGRIQSNAILDAVAGRQFILGSYSGGALYAVEILSWLRAKKRYPTLYFSIDGFSHMANITQLQDFAAHHASPICWCCCFPCCGSPCNALCCHPMNRSKAIKATEKAEREGGPPSLFMERDTKKDDQNCSGYDDIIKNMYDFYRVGYPEDSKVLKDANPHSQIVVKTGKKLLDLTAGYKEYIKQAYGDEIDLVKWEKFIMVSTHHTQNFFGATLMSPHKFHYSLPVAIFNSNENHMGLHKWARVISDNLVHLSVIKFQRRPAYKEVFAHATKLIQDHNVAMVHDEFIDNLLLNLNPLLKKYGGDI